jgi:hypothetical protein
MASIPFLRLSTLYPVMAFLQEGGADVERYLSSAQLSPSSETPTRWSDRLLDEFAFGGRPLRPPWGQIVGREKGVDGANQCATAMGRGSLGDGIRSLRESLGKGDGPANRGRRSVQEKIEENDYCKNYHLTRMARF